MPLNDFDNYADLYNGVTAAQIRAAAEEPAANARVIADIATELGADADAVTGSTEGDITSGTRANAQSVQQSALVLSQAGTYGVSALTEFASYVEAFDTTVADLNQRLRTNVAWSQRLAGEAAAANDEDPPEYAETWAAARAALQPEYTRAVATLDDNAEATASRFEQGPTLANVRELFLAGLLPYSALTALWPSIGVSAQDRYDAYQAAVASGTIPAIEDMTEAERQAFLRDNPGLLEDWTQLPRPSSDHEWAMLQRAIVALALPAVDEEAAQADVRTILDGIDDNATPEQIAAAFSRSAEIASGMAVLLPWAQRHGVDLEHGRFDGRATDAQRYSEEFGKQTWEHRDAIETLLTEGVEREYTAGAGTPRGEYTSTRMESIFSQAEADELRAAWAGSYLVASNEDIGGGWESLPEAMRESISHDDGFLSGRPGLDFRNVAGFLMGAESGLPAGDGLSTELANSVAHSLYNYESPGSARPGDDGGWVGVAGEDVLGAVLERVSLNQEATAALFHGGDVPGFDGHLPDSHHPADFAKDVFGYRWDDGGAAASSLIDWIPEAMEGEGRHHDVASLAWDGVINSVTSTDNGGSGPFGGKNTIETLMDGAMNYNPEVAHSLYRTVGANLDDLATNKATDAMVTNEDHVRLMMLLGSNPDTAQAISASIQHHQQGIAQNYVTGDQSKHSGPAGEMARLQAKLDAGLFNAARAEGLDTAEAERQRIAVITGGADVLSGAVGLVNPGAGFVASTGSLLLDSALATPTPDLNAVDLPGGWVDADAGFHVANLAEIAQLRASNMLLQGLGGDVGPVATSPTTLDRDSDAVRGAAEAAGLAPIRFNGFNDDFYRRYTDLFDWSGPNVEVETLLNGR